MKTYVFSVVLPAMDGVWRKVELRADQTLQDLHYAVQAAFGWDASHEYSFFMSGEAWDGETEYTVSKASDYGPFGVRIEDADGEELPEFDLSNLPPEAMEEALETLADMLDTTPEAIRDALEVFDAGTESPAGDVRMTTIDSLGLKEGDEFLYLFDYGEEWHFQVAVDAIYDFADPDLLYPRLVAAEGIDPPQYPDEEAEDE